MAYLIGTGTSGFVLPKAGKSIDRFGSRQVAGASVIGLALTLVGLSFMRPMGTFVGLGAMSAAFAVLRFTGQGLLTLTSRTMISQWFERRRGAVTSTSNAVMSFAFSLTPALLFALIEFDGFRSAWRILAAIVFLVMGTVIVVFYRNSPETSGLKIDGGRAESANDEGGLIGSDQDFTRSEALRDLRFWAAAVPVMALSSTSTALTFHILDFGSELGFDEERIVQIFVPIAFVSIPVTLLGGWIVDRMSPLVIALVMGVAQIVMYFSISNLDQPVLATIGVISWGLAIGCYAPLTSAAMPRFFGRRHLGAISGVQMSTCLLYTSPSPRDATLSRMPSSA